MFLFFTETLDWCSYWESKQLTLFTLNSFVFLGDWIFFSWMPCGPRFHIIIFFFISCKSFPEAKMTALSQHSANLPANATPALSGRLLSPLPSAGDGGFFWPAPGFNSSLCYIYSMWLRVQHLISRSLKFLMLKTGITMIYRLYRCNKN